MDSFAKISIKFIQQRKSGNEIALFSKIVAMSYKYGYCYMSQIALAEELTVTARTIRNIANTLEKDGWIWKFKTKKGIRYIPLDAEGYPINKIRNEEVRNLLIAEYGTKIQFERLKKENKVEEYDDDVPF